MVVFAGVIIILMFLSITNTINEEIGMCISLFLVIIFTLLIAGTAHKKDVKIVEVLMIVFMVVATVLFGLNIYNLVKKGSNDDHKFQVTVKENKSEKTKLFTYKGVDYFTYNLSEVNVVLTEDDKMYSLKEALEKTYVTLDEMLSLAIPNEGTAGYKIYYDGGESKYPDDKYSIVICGNKKEAIFTTYEYEYTDGICSN